MLIPHLARHVTLFYFLTTVRPIAAIDSACEIDRRVGTPPDSRRSLFIPELMTDDDSAESPMEIKLDRLDDESISSRSDYS